MEMDNGGRECVDLITDGPDKDDTEGTRGKELKTKIWVRILQLESTQDHHFILKEYHSFAYNNSEFAFVIIYKQFIK